MLQMLPVKAAVAAVGRMLMPSTGFIITTTAATTTTTTTNVLPMRFGGMQFDKRVRHA
jgi:hypothetical protein